MKLTAKQTQQIIDVSQEVLREENPISIRHLFYVLAGRLPVLVPKNISGYRRVQGTMMTAREKGIIAWDNFVDATRQILGTRTYPDLESAIEVYKESYVRDLWQGQECRVLVCVEKDTICTAVLKGARPLCVKVHSNHGNASGTSLHVIGALIQTNAEAGLFTHLKYAGDYDKEGCHMDEVIQRDLVKHHGAYNFDFERYTLNLAQVQDMGLATRKTKPKHVAAFGPISCDLDALPSKVLTDLTREAILKHIDVGIWNEQFKIYQEEKERLNNL